MSTIVIAGAGPLLGLSIAKKFGANGFKVALIARRAQGLDALVQQLKDMKIEAAILEVVHRGKEIDGQAYPYSPSLAGAKNERALLPDAMAAVANATAPRHWVPGDLEAVIKTAIYKMLSDGRLVEEDMKDLISKPGRFRRARGLKAVPI